VTSIYDGSSTSARLAGMAFEAVYGECPQAEYTGIALEYGTLPLNEVMQALRADQWLENHPETAGRARADQARHRDAFYTDTPGVEAAGRRAGARSRAAGAWPGWRADGLGLTSRAWIP
jgi:hypothetical protein